MKARTAGMVVAALLMAVSAGYAQDSQLWKTEITPYAWLTGMEGDVTVNSHKAEFDKSFGDLFDAVEFATGALGTVQYKEWVLWSTLDYAKMSTDALDVEDQPTGGSLETDMVIFQIAGGAQLAGWKEGQSVDLLVGLRSFHLKNDLFVYNIGDYSSHNDAVDPMFVVRPSIPIFPSKINGLRLNATLGIGGGGDSDLIYELQPQLQYQFHELFAARLGYRRVGWKFQGDGNDNELNLAMAGVILGVGVTF